MPVCARCGQESPPGFRFCGSCGAGLEEEAAPQEERKVVTVLFCDLVGFTARSEQLDPEDVSATLAPYHARLRAVLEQYGGRVEKFIGDAVMAVFGAPVAHEDDPERAVRAALAIRDELREGAELDVRIAVNTGEALVRPAARQQEGETLVTGDVVNTAARLQTAAPVNGVLVGEATRRATDRTISYRTADPVRAKGKAEPVRVWEALEPRARFGVDVRQQGRTPLVGRERELELLWGALTRAREEREPQLVTIVGVPGIGKSRLVWELFQRTDADPAFVTWRQGRSLPYGEGVSFWALSEIVKAQAGILESDSVGEASAKLEEALSGLDVVADRAWLLRHLRPLAGLDADAPPPQAGEATGAWRQFFEALADRSPLVLVFEDLHWADEGLLDFVDELVDGARGVPLLVVATARPELGERRPGWGGGKANALTISVQPLTDQDTARLAHEVLGQAAVPAELQAQLLARAGGNPLFAEEFARLTAERGTDAELPDTVQALIAARLDALPADEKALLQRGAVVGKVFWVGAVGDLAGEAQLAALERKDFIRRERRSSVAGETEYVFRHVLTRDVAYSQIPRARRARLHSEAAAWLESLSPDRAEDRAEMLAHHLGSALEYARASRQETAELERLARLANRAAGDRSAGLSADGPAARYYRAALALWPDDDPERADVLLDAGRAASRSEAGGEAELEEAARRLLERGDRAAAAEALALHGRLLWQAGLLADSSAHHDRAEELIRDEPDSSAKAFVLAALAGAAMVAGGTDERALRLARAADAIAARLGLVEIRVEALTTIGAATGHLRGLEGVAFFEQALELAESAPTPAVLRTYVNLATLLGNYGDTARAPEITKRGLDEATRWGETPYARFLRSNLPWQEFVAGNWDDALRAAESFLAEVETRGSHYQAPAVLALRGEIRLARDDVEAGLQDSARAADAAGTYTDTQMLFGLLTHRAWMLARAGQEHEALAVADRVLHLWREAPPEAPLYGAPEVAYVLAEVGRESELVPVLERRAQALASQMPLLVTADLIARRRFLDAADTLERTGARTQEAYARLRAGEELIEAGQRGEGEEQIRRASAFWRSVGASRFVREAEALLAPATGASANP